MSWIAAGTAVAGIGSSLLGGGSSAPAPVPGEQSSFNRGDKTVTFNNGLQLKDLQPLLLVVGIGGLIIAAVRIASARKK